MKNSRDNADRKKRWYRQETQSLYFDVVFDASDRNGFGQARNDTWKGNFEGDCAPAAIKRIARLTQRVANYAPWTGESARMTVLRETREGGPPRSRVSCDPFLLKSIRRRRRGILRRRIRSRSRRARGSPARNMQYVLIRGKETAVTAINREKGIPDACARARIAPEPRRYFGKLSVSQRSTTDRLSRDAMYLSRSAMKGKICRVL